MATSISTTKKPSKKVTKPKQLFVTLKIPSLALKTILEQSERRSTSKSASDVAKSSPSPPSSDLAKLTTTSSQAVTPSEPPSTPAPAESAPGDATAADAASSPKKPTSASKPNLKRTATGEPETDSKQKGRPGPKKKPRKEDGSIDHGAAAPPARPKGTKLGPKNSLGAINAGLRALDRSGAPCKRWNRGGLKLKSFTGVQWELATWRAPKTKPNLTPSVTSDTNASSVVSGEKGKDVKPPSQKSQGAEKSSTGESKSNAPESSPIRPQVAAS